MRQFLLIIGVLLAWTSSVTAADKVTLSAKEYKSMMRRMDALQKQINSMGGGDKSSRRRGGSARTKAVETKYERLAQDVSGIYDTLDVVETKSLQDRINWGAELRVRMDNLKVEDYPYWDFRSWNNPAGNTGSPGFIRDESRDNFWSTRFRLNMDADIRRGLSFTGRIAVLKNWADSTPANSNDANAVHVATDTTLKLDRAYIDWVPDLPFPLAFTIGRQPSSEGPPFELKDNRRRQSTYPALVFGGESDGIVATLGMERYTKLRNSGLRFFYAKGFQDDGYAPLLGNVGANGYIPDAINQGGLDDLNVYALFFETEIPKMRNSLFVLGYIKAYDFNDGGLAQLSFQPPTELGDMDLATAHIQFSNIGNIGLDFFYSFGWNEAKPNGNTFTGPDSQPWGLLGFDGTTKNDGDAHYVGVRYTIPVKAMKNPKIGYEFNTGSEYWFSFTLGAAEQYNKLATRGDVHDVYYIQPFNKNLFLRTGYTIIDYDYTNSGYHIGEPASEAQISAAMGGMPVDTKVNNFYLMIDCRF